LKAKHAIFAVIIFVAVVIIFIMAEKIHAVYVQEHFIGSYVRRKLEGGS